MKYLFRGGLTKRSLFGELGKTGGGIGEAQILGIGEEEILGLGESQVATEVATGHVGLGEWRVGICVVVGEEGACGEQDEGKLTPSGEWILGIGRMIETGESVCVGAIKETQVATEVATGQVDRLGDWEKIWMDGIWEAICVEGICSAS